MRSNLRKRWDNLDLKVESVFRKKNSTKKAKVRLKRMHGGFDLGDAYEEIIVPYWKKYGYKPAKFWYQIFCDADQKVDPRYIPDDLYYGEIVPYFSNSKFRRLGEDKCYHDIWFPDLKRPGTICKNIAGVYYSPDMEVISFDEAVQAVIDYKEDCFLKPSIDSGSARLIKYISADACNKGLVEDSFKEMGANFIVQAAVKQHEIMAILNPSSLNTLRIVSLFFEGEVHILSCILRVGAPNAKVDNIGAGGYACPVQMDGQLKEKAVNRKAEWVEENSVGIRFADVKIPQFEKVIETVKFAHKRLAHFKLIGWDMSIDTEGDPVMIEYNSCPGSNQVSCGPTFGDLTERILDEFFNKKSLKNAQN